jgi:hypothetical protein
VIFNWYSEGGVKLGPLGTAATNRPVVSAPGVYDDGEIGGMMIGRRNRSTRRKLAPVPLCPPQSPHAARTWTRADAVGSQRLTAWATARPVTCNTSGSHDMTIKTIFTIIWVMTPFNLVDIYRLFERRYRLLLQGQHSSPAFKLINTVSHSRDFILLFFSASAWIKMRWWPWIVNI